MKILIYGTNTFSDYAAQRLLLDPRIDVLYHGGAHSSRYPSDRFVPFASYPDKVKEIVDTVDFDLIIVPTVNAVMETQVIESARAKNIPILSPDYNLGMLEASKLVGKDLLNKVGIPTPKFETVNREELTNRFKTIPRPFVLKYEDDRRVGLQTIVITDENYEEEYNAFMSAKQSGFMGRTYQDFLDQKFMIEEYLPGKAEYSWHALCNTTGWKFLGAARDYKKRYEGDKGHNTAGMGAYSPVYDLDDRVGEYCDKIVKHLIEQGTPYVGIIYLGIMTGPDGTPHILEINTRPGSPEGETILETVDNNLLDLFMATASNQPIPDVVHNDRVGVSVRIVNKDYSDEMEHTSHRIASPQLWPLTDNIKFTKVINDRLLHSVLTVSDTTREAGADRIYKFLENKPMGDYTFRTDIGYLK